MERDKKTISRADLTFLFGEILEKQGSEVLLKTAIPMINKALDWRENFINKPVTTTNEQPNEQYLQALEILEQEKQEFSTGINGNIFVSTYNGLVTILLKRDGTYEVDTEFK